MSSLGYLLNPFLLGTPAGPVGPTNVAAGPVGHPARARWARNELVSQLVVEQLSEADVNFMAVAAATAALCCSTVPPFSRTLILLRLAMGHPEALQQKCNI